MLTTHLDRLAIILSSMCAIHCVIFPIIASLIPLIATSFSHGNTLHEFWFHQFILIFILPISIFSIISGYCCHKTFTPAIIASLGLMILVFTAAYAGDLIANQTIPHESETWFTVFGGVIHATGHVLNLQATRKNRNHCPT
jgi:ribose/xylose/arabinose/galactoside ABC-type transport system permease subunit